MRAVQLREKDMAGAALLKLAGEVKGLCDRYNAEFFVNDRVDVALASEAAGVHLAANALPVKVARELLGPDRKIGVSTHSVEEARAASEAGADLVLFGPVYPTASKLAFGDPQGPAALKAVTAAASVPIFAIGGIKREHIPELKAHGTARIALISGISEAPDPAATARDMLGGAAGMTPCPGRGGPNHAKECVRSADHPLHDHS